MFYTLYYRWQTQTQCLKSTLPHYPMHISIGNTYGIKTIMCYHCFTDEMSAEAIREACGTDAKNVNEVPRSQTNMLNKTRTLLSRFYQPFNEDLARLLDDSRFLWNSRWARLVGGYHMGGQRGTDIMGSWHYHVHKNVWWPFRGGSLSELGVKMSNRGQKLKTSPYIGQKHTKLILYWDTRYLRPIFRVNLHNRRSVSRSEIYEYAFSENTYGKSDCNTGTAHVQ